jgi:hypothetical protein
MPAAGRRLPGALLGAGAPLGDWDCFDFFSHSIILHGRLKLQAGFARGIGQRFDLAVVTGAAAVKHDLLDAFAEGGLGGQGADALALAALAASFSRSGVPCWWWKPPPRSGRRRHR